MWNHRAEVLSKAQLAAFFGTGLRAHRLFSLPNLDSSQVFFGLRPHLWVDLHLPSVLAIAVHSHVGSSSPLDEAYEGVRIALEVMASFRQGEVPLLDGDDVFFLMDLIRGILSEGWYLRWAEWWHCHDLLASTPQPFSPNKLDTASPIWLEAISDLAPSLKRYNGFSRGWPRLVFSNNSRWREDIYIET